MSERFPNVIHFLDELKRRGGNYEAESDFARQILFGKRPGLQEKYDALLMNLDRSYSRLLDEKNRAEEMRESPLARTRSMAKAQLWIINRLLISLKFMQARNRDLIYLKERQSPYQKPEQ